MQMKPYLFKFRKITYLFDDKTHKQKRLTKLPISSTF